MRKHPRHNNVREQIEQFTALEDALWAARAKAAEAQGEYLDSGESMKDLLNLIKTSPVAGGRAKRRQSASGKR
jgi:hypothetical protein